MEIDVANNETDRLLDVAASASVDVVSLNNQLVGMRIAVKKAKVHSAFKLIRTVTALKKKRGTEEQVNKNLRKAERLLNELDLIRSLGADKVSRYALSNIMTFAEVCKQSTCSVERRALARLCDNKLLKDIVDKFRRDHEDWQSLVSFMMTKQSGRRFRKKVNREKANKVITNQKIGDELVHDFLSKRLGHDVELPMKRTVGKTEKLSDVSDEVSSLAVIKSSKEDKSGSLPVKGNKQMTAPVSDSGSDADDTARSNLEHSKHQDINTIKKNTMSVAIKDKSIDLKHKQEDITNTDHSDRARISSSDNTDIVSNVSTDNIASDDNETVLEPQKDNDSSLHSTSNTQSSRDMVVKKLNLHVGLSDTEEIQIDEQQDDDCEDDKPKDHSTAFLTGMFARSSHGQSDGFFMTLDKDGDNSDEGDNNNDDSVNEFNNKTDYSGKDVGRKSFESMFISSLGDDQSSRRPIYHKHPRSVNEKWQNRNEFAKQKWPNRSDNFRPQNSVNFKSQGSANFRPQNSASFRPHGSANFRPQNSANFRPQARSDFRQQNTVNFRQQNTVNFRPQARSDFRNVDRIKSSMSIPSNSKSDWKPNENLPSKPEVAAVQESTSSLHPSWQASKRRKELSQIHQYQGKRTKFADSDDD